MSEYGSKVAPTTAAGTSGLQSPQTTKVALGKKPKPMTHGPAPKVPPPVKKAGK